MIIETQTSTTQTASPEPKRIEIFKNGGTSYFFIVKLQVENYGDGWMFEGLYAGDPEHPRGATQETGTGFPSEAAAIAAGWDCFWRLQDMEQARTLASAKTQMSGGADVYLPCDASSHVSPRYSVTLAPKVGDQVSKAFNGDSYPEGEIVKVSKSYKRVETSTGVVFYRVRETGCWRADGTWSMRQGHVYEQNPSF